MSKTAKQLAHELREILGELPIESLIEPRFVESLKVVQQELIKHGVSL